MIADALAVGLSVAAGMLGPPPCGEPVVQFVDDAVLIAAHGRPVYADARSGPCVIRLASVRTRRLDAGEWCTIAVHEVGHLHGLEHDAGGFMRPAVHWRAVAGCRARLRSREKCGERNGGIECWETFTDRLARRP